MKFGWHSRKPDNETIFRQIKNNRNISCKFLNSSFDDLPEISLMKDIDSAAERIIRALHQKEGIIIFGHDDLDGITSTYILFDFLEKMGSQNHFYYIPNRLFEDHGMQNNFFEKVANHNINLVITVDGGISDFNAVRKLKDRGCDVIITDHHLVQDELPQADFIINPKQADCNYPFDMLAGVAISYFLVSKIAEKLEVPTDKNYLFWVAVGSIADKVPMINVNRILVKKVLDEWNNFDDPSLKITVNYNSGNYNSLAKINIIRHLIKLMSNGREINGENKSLRFLISSGSEKEKIYQELFKEFNRNEEILACLKSFLDVLISGFSGLSMIHYDKNDDIPLEYLGYSASYVSGNLKIPCLMLKNRDSLVVCEARCAEGFDLIKAFTACSNDLIQFGGHVKAAGFTADVSRIPSFMKNFLDYVDTQRDSLKNGRKLKIDAVVQTHQIKEFMNFLQTDYHFLQPYGEGNPNPVYQILNYCPSRDSAELHPENLSDLPDLDSSYDLILKYNGSILRIIDFSQISDLKTGEIS